MNFFPPFTWYALGIAVVFVAWPLLGKVSGVPPAWFGILVLIGTVLGNLVVGMKDISMSPMFTAKAFTIIMLAGLVNGVGVYYYAVKSADPNIPTAVFVPMVTIMMALLGAILGWAISGTFPTGKQLAGLCLACTGLVLLSQPA